MRTRRKRKPVDEPAPPPPRKRRRRRSTSPTVAETPSSALELEKPNATSHAAPAARARGARQRDPNATSADKPEQLTLDLPLLRDLVEHGRGYRGDEGIQWTMSLGPSLACAVLCRCARWWGWFPERVVVAVRAAMLRDGCRSCA